MNAVEFETLDQTRFLTHWTDDNTTLITPVAFPNVRGLMTTVTAGVGGDLIKQPPADGAWVRHVIREQDIGQKDMGNDSVLVETIGRVETQIYVPRGTGTAGARGLGDRALAIYERYGVPFCTFACADSTAREVGDVDKTDWWRYDVSVPYSRRRFVARQVA